MGPWKTFKFERKPVRRGRPHTTSHGWKPTSQVSLILTFGHGAFLLKTFHQLATGSRRTSEAPREKLKVAIREALTEAAAKRLEGHDQAGTIELLAEIATDYQRRSAPRSTIGLGFFGRCGTGKRGMAKDLASVVFGGNGYAAVDMRKHGRGALFGSPTDPGILAAALKQNSKCLIAIEHAELADVQDQAGLCDALELGHITNPRSGERVSCLDTVFVIISDWDSGPSCSIGSSLMDGGHSPRDTLAESRIFDPRLIEQLRAVLVF